MEHQEKRRILHFRRLFYCVREPRSHSAKELPLPRQSTFTDHLEIMLRTAVPFLFGPQPRVRGPSYPKVDFVVGDAARLLEATSGMDDFYDVVVHEGLLDALMCGEGFDADAESLGRGV